MFASKKGRAPYPPTLCQCAFFSHRCWDLVFHDFNGFGVELGVHFPSILHHCCITFSNMDSALNVHWFGMDFVIIFDVIWYFSVRVCNLLNHQKHCFGNEFEWFSHSEKHEFWWCSWFVSTPVWALIYHEFWHRFWHPFVGDHFLKLFLDWFVYWFVTENGAWT